MNCKKTAVLFLLVFGLFIPLLSAGCGRLNSSSMAKIDPYYITGSRETQENLKDLFTLLVRGSISAENTFAVVREIANTFAMIKEYGKLIHFLSGRTINFPGDPYNSYYLLMIAYAYMQLDSLPVAAQYLDLIVKNYPDLIINGESIHLACLNHLINLTDNWEQRSWYYQELISRFPDKIDLGAAWFMLGQTLEHIGDWNGAIQAYTRYLSYAGAVIPGFPNADYYAKQQVAFNNSNKNWAYENLSALLAAVQEALDIGDAYQLGLCQSKVNFFTRSWGQETVDDPIITEIRIGDFMRGNRIRFENSLDPSSNSTEAFLRTWGWSPYVSTWYLYFRKIYFPLDPEIHGRWEWAGVYYGEKF